MRSVHFLAAIAFLTPACGSSHNPSPTSLVVSEPATVATLTSPHASRPSVAAGDQGYVVAWSDQVGSGYSDTLTVRLDASGVPVAGSSAALSAVAGAKRSWGPDIACGTHGCLLVWIDGLDGSGVVAMASASLDRWSPPSSVVAKEPALSETYNGKEGYYVADPAVAASGDAFFVGWRRQHVTDMEETSELFGVSHQGGASSPSPLPLSQPSHNVRWHDLVTVGSDVWVAFDDGLGAQTVHLRRAADSAAPIALGPGRLPAAASDGSSIAVFFADRVKESVMVSIVDAATGQITAGPKTLVQTTGLQSLAATYDGIAYVVAFEAGDDGAQDILALRVGRDGSAIDAEPFAIAEGDANHTQPAVASDGRGATVVAYLEAGVGNGELRVTTLRE